MPMVNFVFVVASLIFFQVTPGRSAPNLRATVSSRYGVLIRRRSGRFRRSTGQRSFHFGSSSGPLATGHPRTPVTLIVLLGCSTT